MDKYNNKEFDHKVFQTENEFSLDSNVKRLWRASLFVAISDIVKYLFTSGINVHNLNQKKAAVRRIQKLIDYFFNIHEGKNLWLFHNICYELDLNPTKIRLKIIDLIKMYLELEPFINNKERIMQYTIVRAVEFDAGHRVLRHGGKCANLHGHRYKIEFVLTSPDIDKVGVVVDFGTIKSEWGGWLDKYLDHGIILEKNDPMIEVLLEGGHPKEKMYVLPYPATAEGVSRHLFETFSQKEYGEYLQEVIVHETTSCKASWKSIL